MKTTDIIAHIETATLTHTEGHDLLRAVRLAMARQAGTMRVFGRGVLLLPPDGGYIVHERWATGEDVAHWYPQLGGARAALVALGDAEDRTAVLRDEPNDAGCLGFVDLTAPGCERSDAAIWTRDAWCEHQHLTSPIAA